MKVCVVVDAYKFSKDYIRFIKRKGFGVIHIQSGPEPIADLALTSTYRQEDYLASFNYNGDIYQLIDQLAGYEVHSVIAATEDGVELTDLLSASLDLPTTNGIAKSKSRRDKFEMTEALREHGVPTVKYHKSDSITDILAWIDANTEYPVVIKPLSSAGSHGVFICDNEAEVKNRVNYLLTTTDVFDRANDEVLVQALLRGTEYMVNTASCNGKHYITDIWRCDKQAIKGHGVIYDNEKLISSNSVEAKALTAYVTDVLDALGINYGASHTEVMFTADGPILIETGARLSGHFVQDAYSEVLSHTQMELVVDGYTDPAAFMVKTAQPYQKLSNMMFMILASQHEGTIQEMPIIDTIEMRPSFFKHIIPLKVGDSIVPTKDLLTAPGYVLLINDDTTVINKDYRAIKRAQATGWCIN